MCVGGGDDDQAYRLSEYEIDSVAGFIDCIKTKSDVQTVRDYIFSPKIGNMKPFVQS